MTTDTITRTEATATAGRAQFTLTARQMRRTSPNPLMRGASEDYRQSTQLAAPMTYAEVLAALYGFGPADDPRALWAMSIAQLRAEVSRIVATVGMPAVRETADWIARHGEGVRLTDGLRVTYGVHVLVLRMATARPHAARLCSAYGDEFWKAAE